MLLAANFLLQLAFLHLYVTTYLAIFNWVWNDVRVGFRTLLRALLSSFVILLVTTHSDEQLGQSSFLIRRYIRVIWFTRNTRLRRIRPTRKQNRRTSVPTLFLRSHTLKWRPKFPACRSILIAKDCGHKILAGDHRSRIKFVSIISGSSFSDWNGTIGISVLFKFSFPVPILFCRQTSTRNLF